MRNPSMNFDPVLERVEEEEGEVDDSNDVTQYQAMPGLPHSIIQGNNNNKTDEKFEQLHELKQSFFPILRLPRELRDQIYCYSLCAVREVDLRPPYPPWSLVQDNPFKDLSPGLLRTSKQIYHEANDILYARNIFKFKMPRILFSFATQIGAENCKRVRQICIWNKFRFEPRMVPALRYLPQSQYHNYPSHWFTALAACGFDKIVHLGVETEPPIGMPFYRLWVPRDLQELIEEFLGRVPANEVPRLSLTGFHEEERKKFPSKWKVMTNRRNYCGDITEGMLWDWDNFFHDPFSL